MISAVRQLSASDLVSENKSPFMHESSAPSACLLYYPSMCTMMLLWIIADVVLILFSFYFECCEIFQAGLTRSWRGSSPQSLIVGGDCGIH